MTRMQAALAELNEAMAGRPWVLLFDPCSPDAQNWGYGCEHSDHPGYVRLGLIDLAQVHMGAKLVAGGMTGTPISRRGVGTHRFVRGPDGVVRCEACGHTKLDVATSGHLECPGLNEP